jgi:hypothetical protein
VWELLCSICIAFPYAFLHFALHMYHDVPSSLYDRLHACCCVGKASPIYIVHHGMIYMSL